MIENGHSCYIAQKIRRSSGHFFLLVFFIISHKLALDIVSFFCTKFMKLKHPGIVVLLVDNLFYDIHLHVIPLPRSSKKYMKYTTCTYGKFFLYLAYSYHLRGIVSTFDPIQFVGGTKNRDDFRRFYFHSKFSISNDIFIYNEEEP